MNLDLSERLRRGAEELNSRSDLLNTQIASLESALNSLNIGVECRLELPPIKPGVQLYLGYGYRGDLLQIAARMDLRAYARFSPEWKHVKARPGELERHHSMSQPYIMLFQNVIIAAVNEARDRGETRPIEIVFDVQEMLKSTLLSGFESLREIEAADPKRLALMPPTPGFRDDKDFVILQAADMLAGERRLAAERYPDNPDFIGKLCPNLPFSKYSRAISDDDMEAVHAHLLGDVYR